MAGIMSDSSFGKIPSGTTANRPASPAVGDQYYNGTLGVLEIYTSSGWLPATGANDFNVALTGTHTSTTFTKEYFAGAYTINSALADTSYDIYVYSTDGSLSGYTKTPSLVATGNFNKIVVLGGSSGDLLSFSYKTTFTTSTESSQLNAGAYISSISASSMPNIGDSITVTGGNFASNVAVHFTGTGYSSTAAKTVVRNSATSLTVTRPDNLPVSGSPYTITVTNPSISNQPTGSNSHKITLTAGAAPVWVTSSSLSLVRSSGLQYTFSATDSDGGSSITYSVASGTLPTGSSLNSSTGVLSPLNVLETSTVTLRATDSGGNYADREFTILVSLPVTGGTQTSDSTYYYNVFKSNTTATVLSAVTADIFAIGGGGGATGGLSGVNYGAGGASGVTALATSQSLSATTYNVVVGAGGTGVMTGTPGNGTNSTFASLLTATPGSGTGHTSRTGGSNASYSGGTDSSGVAAGGGAGSGANGSGPNGGNGTTAYSSWLASISSIMSDVSGWSSAVSGGHIGGGGTSASVTTGSGGLGGGGSVVGSVGNNAITNTGSGGAGSNASTNGTNGGSGLIVLRYTKSQVGG
jgi:hypothetical protein